VSHFFYEDPKTRQSTALEVYLGNLGPLHQRVYQASSPGPLMNVSPFIHSLTAPDAGPSGDHHGVAIAPGPAPGAMPPRYTPAGPLHSIVIIEMPPIADVIKALQEDVIPHGEDGTDSSADKSTPGPDGSRPPPASLAGRSLPILFIRACDGVGYHSGRTVALENVFSSMDLGGMGGNPGGHTDAGWLAAAQAAVGDGGLQGWTFRVL
jgi:recombining binding protein suppressor of hairless